jgi:GAF domain-containing protein
VIERSLVPEAGLDRIIAELRLRTASDRCTLRLNIAGDYEFPVICEERRADVDSLRDFRTLPQLAGPTFRRILRERQTVVQNDCRSAAAGADPEFAEPYFRDLIELYGGMSAFIAAPVFITGELEGVVSVHALGAPRTWTADEVATAEQAAGSIAGAIASSGTET